MAPSPLALTLSLAGVGVSEGIALAGRLADHGYAAVWGAEVQGPEIFTQLGAVAATTDLDIGVAVVPAQTRTPFVLAMTALTLSEMSGGRFSLGIGASSENIVEKWAGLPYDKPLTDVRECYQAIRPVLNGDHSAFEGSRVKLSYRPYGSVPTPIPLLLGALNPRSLRMVGELGADGLCLNQQSVTSTKRMIDEVRAGAAGAGVELRPDFAVVSRYFCAVTDDVDSTRGLIKMIFAPYVATVGYNRFHRWQGFEDVAQGVLDAGRDKAAAAAAISDEFVDEIFCIGSIDDVCNRLKEHVDAGLTMPTLVPLAPSVDAAEQMLTSIADTWHAA
ncbi:MAG TPA: LLM class flavin-dependent oxidoreductase [Acidimicrobiales bacterium]